MDAQENTRMTISRWLRIKADEEIREIARAEANKEWDEWLARMREAERNGKPFDGPTPSSRR